MTFFVYYFSRQAVPLQQTRQGGDIMLRKLAVAFLLAFLASTAIAVPVTNGDFESGLTGWTIDPGTMPSRSTTVGSFLTGGQTIVAPEGGRMLRLIAGTSVIAGGDPEQFVSRLYYDDPISVTAGQYFTMLVNFTNTDFTPDRVDWLGIGIDGGIYPILQGIPINTTTGWLRLAIQFLSSGEFGLELDCGNHKVVGASSSCAFDDIQVVDSLPVSGNIPVFQPLAPFRVTNATDSGGGTFEPVPPTTNIPEPGTLALCVLGLFGLIRSRKS